MKNEDENFVPEIDPDVRLDPQGNATVNANGSGNDNSGNTVAPSAEGLDKAVQDAAAALGLDEETQRQLKEVLQPLQATVITPRVVEMLASALRHDEDVSNAEAAGYVRGRNDNIDALLHPQQQQPVAMTFPRYVRRSVWE